MTDKIHINKEENQANDNNTKHINYGLLFSLAYECSQNVLASPTSTKKILPHMNSDELFHQTVQSVAKDWITTTRFLIGK